MLDAARRPLGLCALPLVKRANLVAYSPVELVVEGPHLITTQSWKEFLHKGKFDCPRLIEWTCDGRTCNASSNSKHSGRGIIGSHLFMDVQKRDVFTTVRNALFTSVIDHFKHAFCIETQDQHKRTHVEMENPAASSIVVGSQDDNNKRTKLSHKVIQPSRAGVAQFIPKAWLSHCFRYLNQGGLAAAACTCRAWCDAVYTVPRPQSVEEGVHIKLPPGAAKQLSTKIIAQRFITAVSGFGGRSWAVKDINELHGLNALQSIHVSILLPKTGTRKLLLPPCLTSLTLSLPDTNETWVQELLDQLPIQAPALSHLNLLGRYMFRQNHAQRISLGFLQNFSKLKTLEIQVDVDWKTVTQALSIESISITDVSDDCIDRFLSELEGAVQNKWLNKLQSICMMEGYWETLDNFELKKKELETLFPDVTVIFQLLHRGQTE